MGQIADAIWRVVERTLTALGTLVAWLFCLGLAFFFLVIAAQILQYLFSPPTAKDQFKAAADAQALGDKREAARREKKGQVLFLCEQAAACKKYDAARLECATAGNLKTCLRIKMGDDDMP